MRLLPENTLLGKLEIIEVYDFFDNPCLFLCQNATRNFFLSLWVDEDDSCSKWVYAPISLFKINRARMGEYELREIFQKTEDSFVFIVSIKSDTSDDDVRCVDCGELGDDILPGLGEYLYPENSQLDIEEFSSPESARLYSEQSGRSLFDLRLIFSDFGVSQGSLQPLSKILGSTQKLIDSIVELQSGDAQRKGPIKKATREKAELKILETYPGSLGFRMASVSSGNLFDETDIDPALEMLVELIEASCKRQDLNSILSGMRARVKSSYRVFLHHCVKSDVSLEAKWSSVSRRKKLGAFLSLENAKNALSLLEDMILRDPIEYSFKAELVGVNKRTKFFEVRDIKNDKRYSGRVMDEVLEEVSRATISRLYNVLLIEEIEIDSQGEEKIKYKLTDLQKL
jgi:hypothetical protein